MVAWFATDSIFKIGDTVGVEVVGDVDGDVVGLAVVGDTVGGVVGEVVGVGLVGHTDGEAVGEVMVGDCVGDTVGVEVVGDVDGDVVGLAVVGALSPAWCRGRVVLRLRGRVVLRLRGLGVLPECRVRAGKSTLRRAVRGKWKLRLRAAGMAAGWGGSSAVPPNENK